MKKKSVILFTLILSFTMMACNGDKEVENTSDNQVWENVVTEAPIEEPPVIEEPSVTEDSPVEDSPVMADVVTGDARPNLYLSLLEGKKVAILSNQTGIVGDDEGKGHILDFLIENGVNVTAIFSPEHGFRGDADAGAGVDNSVDSKTGVPILSLYGNGHYPADSDMDSFDVLVVDIQDVGLRYYTYYITMFYMMEACSSADKEVVILDRPNPNGFYVDGGILKDEYKSGVGLLPIPTVHGMTLGELAQMIDGEGWLKTGKNSCKLTVIPCDNYTHSTLYELKKNPSPNIKDMRAVYLYASTCYFENTVISVGRGTDFPFEAYGSPYLEGVTGNEFTFTPVSMTGASSPLYEGEVCYGKDLRLVPMEDVLSNGINLNYLIDAYNDYKSVNPDGNFWGNPDKNGHYWVDLLSGSDEVRTLIEEGKTSDEIKETWKGELDKFRESRKKYLLYGD